LCAFGILPVYEHQHNSFFEKGPRNIVIGELEIGDYVEIATSAPVLSCLPPRLASRDANAGESKNGGLLAMTFTIFKVQSGKLTMMYSYFVSFDRAQDRFREAYLAYGFRIKARPERSRMGAE